MEMTILQRIAQLKEGLPKKQKQLCNYMLENYHDIEILTVKELASAAGVGTTTVLRLTKLLGYENFFDLRKEFHTIQSDYMSKWGNVQDSFKKDATLNDRYGVIEQVVEEAIITLRETVKPQLLENFNKAIDLLIDASKINVFGLRPYKASAIYFDLLLSEFNPKVCQLSNDSDSVFERVMQFKEDEVLILFGFDPYTKRTFDVASLAHKNNVSIILFTDQLSCPIIQYADAVLCVSVSQKHFSILPVFAIVEAMIIEVGKRTSSNSIENLQKLVPVLKEMDVIL